MQLLFSRIYVGTRTENSKYDIWSPRIILLYVSALFTLWMFHCNSHLSTPNLPYIIFLIWPLTLCLLVCHSEGQVWPLCQSGAIRGWSTCPGCPQPKPNDKATHIFLQTECGLAQISENHCLIYLLSTFPLDVAETDVLFWCVFMTLFLVMQIWMCQNVVKQNSQFVKLLAGPESQTCVFQIKRILGFCCRYWTFSGFFQNIVMEAWVDRICVCMNLRMDEGLKQMGINMTFFLSLSSTKTSAELQGW